MAEPFCLGDEGVAERLVSVSYRPWRAWQEKNPARAGVFS